VAVDLPGFDQVATAYSRDGTTRLYSVVEATGIVCRLSTVRRQAAGSGAGRSELSQLRLFQWDPAVVLKSGWRVVVTGVENQNGTATEAWNLEAGTLAVIRGPDGSALYRRADVVAAT
jgi:hypothetical protein